MLCFSLLSTKDSLDRTPHPHAITIQALEQLAKKAERLAKKGYTPKVSKAAAKASAKAAKDAEKAAKDAVKATEKAAEKAEKAAAKAGSKGVVQAEETGSTAGRRAASGYALFSSEQRPVRGILCCALSLDLSVLSVLVPGFCLPLNEALLNV